MPFDKGSGQIFQETSVRVGKRWYCKCSPTKPRKRGAKAPPIEERQVSRALADMTIRTLLRNLHAIDEDSVRHLPVHILERLWSAIKYHALDSVRVWQIFASMDALSKHDKQRTWIHAGSSCQYHGLRTNIKWTTSTSIHWLTNLTLLELKCSVEDLLYINELRNLRNLVIEEGDNDRCHVSDSILREWAYSTKRYGTLSYLQTIFLAGQNVTSWCIQYLEQFPNLDTFCAFLCRFGERPEVRKIAEQAGWDLDHKNSALQHFAKEKPGYRSQVSTHGCPWTQLASSYAEHRRCTEPSTSNDLPHLELSFGRAGRKSRKTMRYFSVVAVDFFCFERNRNNKSLDTDPAGDNTRQAHVSDQLPAKRRKLKHGRVIPMQHIFFDD